MKTLKSVIIKKLNSNFLKEVLVSYFRFCLVRIFSLFEVSKEKKINMLIHKHVTFKNLYYLKKKT
jgi:hypothetical protein